MERTNKKSNKKNNKRRNKRNRRRLLKRICLILVMIISVNVIIDICNTKSGMAQATEKEINDIVKAEIEADAEDNMVVEKKEIVVPDEYMIDMTGLSQDKLPTGCESVSTVTVLNYYNIMITPEEFVDTYLECQSFYVKGGKVYGANPNKAFVGSPYEKSSLGCFAEVIKNACENMKNNGYEKTENINIKLMYGKTMDNLAKEYVANNEPVILWVTMDMKESYNGVRYYLEDGSEYIWKAMEHCMVLCGYDNENYYLKDPLKDGNTVSYSRELVEARYNEMGSQAVVISRKSE